MRKLDEINNSMCVDAFDIQLLLIYYGYVCVLSCQHSAK